MQDRKLVTNYLFDQYKDDLEYFYNELKKHPVFIRKPDVLKDFQAHYDSIIQNKDCNTYEKLAECATDLTMFFQDGHTNIELPYTENDEYIYLPCEWENNYSDKLLLVEGVQGISPGAEVISIENLSIAEVIQQLEKIIPHENRYWVKSRMIHHAYSNYHMFSALNLHRLFGKKDSYKIEFCENGEVISRMLFLTKYEGNPTFRDEERPFYYEIVNGNIVVHIDACICDQRYLDFLQEVAITCEEEHIQRMILDLSKNGGGTTNVIEEFIAYTHTDKYIMYSVLDYSCGLEEVLADRHCEIVNEKKETLFPKDIQLQVGYDTFSSARTFAVTLIDNNIVTLMEGCSGGKPNSYGAPRRGVLPNSNMRYRVSTRLFLRPDTTKDRDECIKK